MYNRAMFRREKAEIKLKLATHPSVVSETKKLFERLEDNAATVLDKYHYQLEKWNNKMKTVVKVNGRFFHVPKTMIFLVLQMIIYTRTNRQSIWSAKQKLIQNNEDVVSVSHGMK